jgi:hypothetical protein
VNAASIVENRFRGGRLACINMGKDTDYPYILELGFFFHFFSPSAVSLAPH